MDIDEKVRLLGLELEHSDSKYTRVSFEGSCGGKYEVEFATHMFDGECSKLSYCIITQLLEQAKNRGKNDIRTEFRRLMEEE
jgi:hypothetical protein